jgi:hypothetical protein
VVGDYFHSRIRCAGISIAPKQVRLKAPANNVDPVKIEATAVRWLQGDRTVDDIQENESPLTPPGIPRFRFKIVPDSITGLPVLHAGPNAPMLTSEEVADLLTNFP